MSKYILVYKFKEAFDTSELPKEQVAKMMEAWGEWLGRLGSAVVDAGEAFKYGGKSVTADSVSEADNLLGGYSLVEAKDFDEALSFAQGSPILARGGSVEVYEAFAV